MDEGPPEKLTGVPTVVVDQLVNGVVAADDELVLEELLPPAQAIKVIGKTKMARFFKIDPYSQLWQMKLAFNYIYNKNIITTLSLTQQNGPQNWNPINSIGQSNANEKWGKHFW